VIPHSLHTPQVKRLGKVYYAMYNKLKSIQIGTKFDELIEDRRNRSFKDKSDDWFFEEMARCIFAFMLEVR